MMYDTFSNAYDRFVNWDNRLQVELPFLEDQLKKVNATTVLDSACGTGIHAIALAQKGFASTGADLSAGMITRARLNAQVQGLEIPFYLAGFGEFFTSLEQKQFGAVLCLGNSLPHLLSLQSVYAALADFYRCLLPGGVLIIQNRNFDMVLSQKERWMEPQSHQEGAREWLFLRFYDYEPTGLITFNIITLEKQINGSWEQEVVSTQLYPVQHLELKSALENTGFNAIHYYGNMQGVPFNTSKSGNLVVVAKKPV
jgi:SAM-dependent methyltransferase